MKQGTEGMIELGVMAGGTPVYLCGSCLCRTPVLFLSLSFSQDLRLSIQVLGLLLAKGLALSGWSTFSPVSVVKVESLGP